MFWRYRQVSGIGTKIRPTGADEVFGMRRPLSGGEGREGAFLCTIRRGERRRAASFAPMVFCRTNHKGDGTTPISHQPRRTRAPQEGGQ